MSSASGMTTCTKGHIYDSSEHHSCPYCRHGSHPLPTPNPGPVIPSNPGHGQNIHIERKTEVIGTDAPVQTNDTRALNPKTVLYNIKTGVDTSGRLPAVGWLVVIEGPGMGSDFRLVQGDNRIGRNEDLEVSLFFGEKSDTGISREMNALVIYDPVSRNFYVDRTVGGKNMPLLNGNSIMRLQEIKHGDIIQISATKLIFIPLCSPAFDWSLEAETKN